MRAREHRRRLGHVAPDPDDLVIDRKRLAVGADQRAVHRLLPVERVAPLPIEDAVGAVADRLPCHRPRLAGIEHRSEEHTSELQSLMRISYAVFCLKITTSFKIFDSPSISTDISPNITTPPTTNHTQKL